jgi:hypothetical protein
MDRILDGDPVFPRRMMNHAFRPLVIASFIPKFIFQNINSCCRRYHYGIRKCRKKAVLRAFTLRAFLSWHAR